MDIQKVLIAIVGLLASFHVFATAHCLPGVYSDGVTNAAILRDEVKAGIRCLMLDGAFGNTQSEFIRLNNEYRNYKPPFCPSSEASYLKSPNSFTVQVATFAVGPAQIALIMFVLAVKPLIDGSLDVSCPTAPC